MLRVHIERQEDSGGVILRLEGKLVHPWVTELANTWEKVLEKLPQGYPIRVDLHAVPFVDGYGRALLDVMGRMGCVLRGPGPFLAGLTGGRTSGGPGKPAREA